MTASHGMTFSARGMMCITRKHLLTEAAALLVAGCGVASHQSRGAGPSVTTRPPIVVQVQMPIPEAGPPLDFYTMVPGLMRAFNQRHSLLKIMPASVYVPKAQTLGVYLDAVYPATGFGIPLNAALRSANFNPADIQPGLLPLFSVNGQLLGLPVAQTPIAVRVRKDVWRAAAMRLPSFDWTITDFLDACDRIAYLVARKRVPGLEGVLFPLWGYVVAERTFTGVLWDPAWWMAFALGYGGHVVAEGRFFFDEKALEGLSVLVEIGRRYGSKLPLGRLPGGREALTSTPKKYAIFLDLWAPAPGASLAVKMSGVQRLVAPFEFDDRWIWARVPRFPARGLVTTLVRGEGFAGRIGAGFPDHAIEALLWLYSPDAQALLDAWGAPPVLAAWRAQSEFWQRQGDGGQDAVGWQDITSYAWDWPGYPPTDGVFAALMAGMNEGPEIMRTKIAAAATQMNSYLSGER
jgi:ABC-type glycerol-3-phosphate transport system substrate-binding protein